MRFIMIAWALALLLVACAAPPTPLPGQALPGTEWELATLHGRQLVEGTNITLSFEVLVLRGFAGCNHYSADYQLVGNELQISFISITAQLCQEPQGVMAQEEAYMAALQRVATYRIADDRLTTWSGADDELMVFRQRVPSDMDPADLMGTRWRLDTINDGAPPGPDITLEIPEAGVFTGFAGCRHYEARYQAEGDKIQLTMIAMKETDCDASEEVKLREADYTTHLEMATHYRLFQGQLDLVTARGDVLRFVPLP